MPESENSKFIPGSEALMKAATSLPPSDSFRGDTFHAQLGDSRVVEFRKIKFRNSRGKKVSRWVYDGKVMFS